MTPNELLTLAHVAVLLGIVGFVASYQPDGETRYRPAVSLFATCLAGTALASAVQVGFEWHSTCRPPQIWQTLFSACVFFAVARTRGNVAKLFPRLKWSHHQ